MSPLDMLSQDSLSKEAILRYVDDYSIYCKYIGSEMELNTRYHSPLREGDDNPSFALFQGKDRIMFKDFATTWKGDVFQFVKILMSKNNTVKVTFPQVLRQIDSDFQIGLYTEDGTLDRLNPIKAPEIPRKVRYNINVTSYKNPTQSFIDYWTNKYDISLETLQYYNCSNVCVLHYSCRCNSHKFQIYPKTLCIAYQIGGRYKIYFPFESKKNKFQNDFPPEWVEGYIQLKRVNDFVIITKAMKEVMFFREHFNWDTVAGKSENTIIQPHIMSKLFSDYKRVYIWLDKDTAGINAQEEYLKKYPKLIPISYKDFVEQKDPTDRYEFMKKLGMKELALKEIKKLIQC